MSEIYWELEEEVRRALECIECRSKSPGLALVRSSVAWPKGIRSAWLAAKSLAWVKYARKTTAPPAP